MQPLVLRIPGKYWDSQIYKGRLYLFTIDGSIRTVDWDRFIYEWEIGNELRIVLDGALARSDYFYSSYYRSFFADKEIRELLKDKYKRLNKVVGSFDSKRILKYLKHEQDTPFPFPHSDTTIYRDHLYVSSKKGIDCSACSKRNKNPINPRKYTIWDGPSLSIAASYDTLAIAAGNEGLFEYSLGSEIWDDDETDEPIRRVKRNCIAVSWDYHSIFGSSHVEDAFLASYRLPSDAPVVEQQSAHRKLEKIIDAFSIFDRHGYAWSYKNRICCAVNGTIMIADYNPYSKADTATLKKIGEIPSTISASKIVSARVAAFGIIAEYESALVVYPSDSHDPITIPGEPVSWRAFPSAHFYQNHLHVVYQDHIAILSFNHDYFVEQDSKISGSRPVLERIRRS